MDIKLLTKNELSLSQYMLIIAKQVKEGFPLKQLGNCGTDTLLASRPDGNDTEGLDLPEC